MEKFSVKKPFTVLVAVIMVLMLGFVSITKMKTNLLPNVSTPYLMVVTVYPGASPERVESEVSDVMENALGTVAGVDTITATSAENYSLLLMKFSEGTDMNSTMVKVSNKVDQTVSSLPSSCLTPSIIEYSMNMNAFMTVAISREGSDVYDLSDFVSGTLVPYVERRGGVSSISANGLIEKMVQVQLNQDKIDEVNARLLELIDTQLADARAQLDAAEAQIAEGRAEYEKQLKNFGNTVSDTVMAEMGTEVADAVTVVRDQAQALLNSVNQLIGVVNEPEIRQALIDVRDGLQRVVDQFNQTGMRDIDSLIEIVGELRDITDKLDSVGNTTAAIGKGFAIGSAALATLSMMSSYLYSFTEAGQSILLNLIDPMTLAGALVGAALPFLFSGMLIDAVAKAARKMVVEVRRQFREIKGLLQGEVLPDYKTCIEISSQGALKEMRVPAVMAILFPVVCGFLFGAWFVGGLLIGATISAIMLAIFTGNAGGAWDNAKKYVETGAIEGHGKGSPAHDAAVVGDTVGDPLKDTVGPSLDILIKIMSVVSLVTVIVFQNYNLVDWIKTLF